MDHPDRERDQAIEQVLGPSSGAADASQRARTRVARIRADGCSGRRGPRVVAVPRRPSAADPGRQPRGPRSAARGQRRRDLRRPTLLPEQRRHHLPGRQASQRQQGQVGREHGRAGRPRLQQALAGGLPAAPDPEREHLGVRDRARDLLGRLRHAGARLQAAQRRGLGEAQPAAEPLVPLLHAQHRAGDLGRPRPQEQASLRLRRDEAAQRRQADEERLAVHRARQVREAAGPTSDPKAVEPARPAPRRELPGGWHACSTPSTAAGPRASPRPRWA